MKISGRDRGSIVDNLIDLWLVACGSNNVAVVPSLVQVFPFVDLMML